MWHEGRTQVGLLQGKRSATVLAPAPRSELSTAFVAFCEFGTFQLLLPSLGISELWSSESVPSYCFPFPGKRLLHGLAS